MEAKQIIAKRVAQEFKNGDFINLGIGLPTMAVDYISKPIDDVLLTSKLKVI